MLGCLYTGKNGGKNTSIVASYHFVTLSTPSESNSKIKLAKLVFFCLKLPGIPDSDLPLTLVVFREDIINLSQYFVYSELTK